MNKNSSEKLKIHLRNQARCCANNHDLMGNLAGRNYFYQAAERIEELEKALKDLVEECIENGESDISVSIMSNAKDILKR